MVVSELPARMRVSPDGVVHWERMLHEAICLWLEHRRLLSRIDRGALGVRLEAKVDELIRMAAGDEKAQKLIDRIDERYLRASGHAKPHGHGDLGYE